MIFFSEIIELRSEILQKVNAMVRKLKINELTIFNTSSADFFILSGT